MTSTSHSTSPTGTTPASPGIGALLPPDNPTVARELRALVPPDLRVETVPLPPQEGELRERLLGYNQVLTEATRSLRDSQRDVVYFACTGSSYLVGPDRDPELQAALVAGGATRPLTAAQAILDTLSDLGKRRVLVVSPYPNWLTDLAVQYWNAAGLTVAGVSKVSAPQGIYALRTAEVVAALRELRPEPGTCVLLSGTGMPTIDAISTVGDKLGVPVISSSLAAGYQALRRLDHPVGKASCLANDLIGRWL